MKLFLILFAAIGLSLAGCRSTDSGPVFKTSFAEPAWVNTFAVTRPSVPSARFTITDYGAVADGKTMNTDAINKALDACAKAGGGSVVIPAGRFLSGPIGLSNNTDLHLDKGATLLFSDDPAAFNFRGGGYSNDINANGCHDISITGSGTIDGQGQKFWNPVIAAKKRAATLPEGTIVRQPRRPRMIVLNNCERVLVQGVTLTNSPMFHLVPSACKDVTIDSIHILAPGTLAPNTDGIDPSGLNFLITHCVIDTGDDNIALKPGSVLNPNQASCENFLITDCTFRHGHGMSIGSQSHNGVRNMVVRNSTFSDTTAGIRLKSGRDRGGIVENVVYENLTMKNVKTSIEITSYYPKIPIAPEKDPIQEVTDWTPIWRNIQIRNLTSTGGETSIQMVGLPEAHIQDITLTNVKISSVKPMQIVNADNVRFINTQISASNGKPDIIVNSDVEGLGASTRPQAN